MAKQEVIVAGVWARQRFGGRKKVGCDVRPQVFEDGADRGRSRCRSCRRRGRRPPLSHAAQSERIHLHPVVRRGIKLVVASRRSVGEPVSQQTIAVGEGRGDASSVGQPRGGRAQKHVNHAHEIHVGIGDVNGPPRRQGGQG